MIKNKVIANEKKAIYQYGFQIGMEVCLNTIISIVIAIICNMEFEAILFLLFLYYCVRMQVGCI